MRGKAPRTTTLMVCVILYLIAVAAHFGLVRLNAEAAAWSWILGFGLLLVSVRLRGL